MLASYGVSERRACDVFPTNRATIRYRSRRPDQASLEMRIKDLAVTRVRYGYRRIHVLLRREGWRINHKKTRRIYRELGLQLRKKTPKRKVKAKLREDRVPATAPNECWSMDFLSDQLFDGHKIRVLSIVDNYTRLSPALDVRFTASVQFQEFTIFFDARVSKCHTAWRGDISNNLLSRCEVPCYGASMCD